MEISAGNGNFRKFRGISDLYFSFPGKSPPIAEAEPDASSFGEESSKGKQVEKRRPEDFMEAMGRTTWLGQVPPLRVHKEDNPALVQFDTMLFVLFVVWKIGTHGPADD